MDRENQQPQRFAVELLEGESLSHFLGRFRRANSLTTTALGKITGLGAVVGRWEKLYLNPFPSRQELEALADVVMVDADRLAQMLPPKGVTMPVSNAAIAGLKLYGKYGGSKKLRLSQALAEGSSITAKDIDEMLNFFENNDIDQSKPGWGDIEYPSVDWIRWLLMGGDAGWHWARTTKDLASAMGEKL